MRLKARVDRLERRSQSGPCDHPCHRPKQIRTIEVRAGESAPPDGDTPRPRACPICGGEPWSGITTIIVEVPEEAAWAS